MEIAGIPIRDGTLETSAIQSRIHNFLTAESIGVIHLNQARVNVYVDSNSQE